MKKLFAALFTLLYVTNYVYGQATEQSLDSKMNDFLRNSDKLYVVVSILVTIFTVIIIYLIYQDYKIRKLEKEIKNKFPKNL
jgi:hypothetical protein